VLLVLAALLLLPAPAGAQPQIETVVELEFPAGIAFDSAGRMYVTERAGRIRVVDQGRLRKQPLATIATTTEGETGLLGIAVDPGEEYVYAFATAPDGASNRVLRVPIEGGEPEIVIDGLPASLYHNGGGLAFDRDGFLFVGNGEKHESELAQDPETLGGKVYRYTANGDVSEDNPFGPHAAYAIGLRNPFGLTIDPVSGLVFVTENGPSSHDEINRIIAGGNYGWPELLGRVGGGEELEGTYQDPLVDFPDIVVPTGIAVANPANAASRVAGDLFFGTYGEGAIHRVRLDERRAIALSEEVFLDVGEPVVAVAWGPEGLYFSTPDAVKVVPLTRPDKKPTASAPPAAEPPPRAPVEDRGPQWLGPLLAVALLGGLLLFMRSRLRR
jgi:glucose/arabinose dehydrogenase